MGSASTSQCVTGRAGVGLSPTLSPGDPAPKLLGDEPEKPSGTGEESI